MMDPGSALRRRLSGMTAEVHLPIRADYEPLKLTIFSFGLLPTSTGISSEVFIA